MTDVMQQSGGAHDCLILLADGNRFVGFAQQGQRPAREMVRAQCVLEASVRGAWIDEIRPTELSNVAKSLEDFGVDEL